MLESSTVYILFGCLSAICSFSVVLTGIVFPDMMLKPSKPFSHLLFCLSFSDFIASSSNILGFPEENSLACPIQAFFFNMFMSLTWILTSVMVYQLYSLILYKRLWLRLLHIYIFACSLALFLTLIPLTTNDYGIDDIQDGASACGITGNDYSAQLWNFFAFYGLLLSCFASMVYWSYKIYTTIIKNNKGGEVTNTYNTILNTTFYYSTGMICCWLPIIIVDIIFYFSPETFADENSLPVLILELSEIISTCYGVILFFIFFRYSPQVRLQWKSFLFTSETRESEILFVDNSDELADEVLPSYISGDDSFSFKNTINLSDLANPNEQIKNVTDNYNS
jgi:hypothetical protein